MNLKEKKLKKIDYYLECNEKIIKQLAFSLFDLLDFKENIALTFFRALKQVNFTNNQNFKLVNDVLRPDCFCVFFHKIKTNLEINKFMEGNYEYPTEITYIPINVDFETFLYNKKYLDKYNSITINLSLFEALIDHEGIHLSIETEYFESHKIYDTLNLWENSLNVKYIKK